jgi:hypothetical protein
VKDAQGRRLIQEDMLCGDSPQQEQKENLYQSRRHYLITRCGVKDDNEMGIKVLAMKKIMDGVKKEVNECTCAKMKMEFYPQAYDTYGITYIRDGVVLPAHCLETIKLSWKQDYSQTNTKKLHMFWDHLRQKQTLWAEVFSQEVMASCYLAYDPLYKSFQAKNRTKKQGPKFKDGVLSCVLFYMKTKQMNFRKSNQTFRGFAIGKRGKKGLVGNALELQLKAFCVAKPVVTDSIEEKDKVRAVVEIKRKDKEK